MSTFLRNNWIYVVAPLGLIALGLGIFLLFFSDSSNICVYTIF